MAGGAATRALAGVSGAATEGVALRFRPPPTLGGDVGLGAGFVGEPGAGPNGLYLAIGKCPGQTPESVRPGCWVEAAQGLIIAVRLTRIGFPVLGSFTVAS